MAQKQRTYTIRNKMTGEIVGYWDGIPNSDDTIKARLRQEFGQGRFQITYTGRKKIVDDDGKERVVTHPVNQFFVVGSVSHGMHPHNGIGDPMLRPSLYTENYSTQHYIGEILGVSKQLLNDVQAIADNVAITRSNVEALMTEDEEGLFDDVEEKSGFSIETIATNPKYSWAVPLLIAGDNDGFINGLSEKLKSDPKFLHDLISDIVGGSMGDA